MSSILPVIAGNSDMPSEENLRFTNLHSITEQTTVDVQPDFFDGARPGDVHKEVRTKLNKTVVPTKHSNAPIAPNFFVEVKAPTGVPIVAQRQALHDGACGARAMHSLQNYGRDEPVYDDIAYTYSSTYQDGYLRMYAHHATAPTTPRGRPEYHMSEIKGFAIASDRETFVRGVTAFRNARDLAKDHRDEFIEEANARALRYDQEDDPLYTAEQDEGNAAGAEK